MNCIFLLSLSLLRWEWKRFGIIIKCQCEKCSLYRCQSPFLWKQKNEMLFSKKQGDLEYNLILLCDYIFNMFILTCFCDVVSPEVEIFSLSMIKSIFSSTETNRYTWTLILEHNRLGDHLSQSRRNKGTFSFSSKLPVSKRWRTLADSSTLWYSQRSLFGKTNCNGKGWRMIHGHFPSHWICLVTALRRKLQEKLPRGWCGVSTFKRVLSNNNGDSNENITKQYKTMALHSFSVLCKTTWSDQS